MFTRERDELMIVKIIQTDWTVLLLWGVLRKNKMVQMF